MTLYRKINRIIQALPFIYLIIMIFCLCFVVITPHVFASGPDEARGKISSHEINKQEGMNMEENEKLTKEQGELLLSVARKTIEARLFNRDIQPEKGLENEKYLEKRGTFVTLTTNGNLRGCIGHIIPQESLIDGIRENAINAAFKDPRFAPLSKEEWDKVKVEISILTEPIPLKYSGADDLLMKLKPGIDGLIIEKGYQSATFLPQVWDQLPDKEEFLRHLCMKAGLSANEWKKGTLTVYTYQVQAFEEEH
jgi:AmmeMemoRadiSam system protein A